MVPLDEWLAVRGDQYATLLDMQREHICRTVTERLKHASRRSVMIHRAPMQPSSNKWSMNVPLIAFIG